MSAVTFGLILFLASFMLGKFHTETRASINLKPWAWAARILAIVMVAVGFVVSTIVIVPAGYRGVLLRFSAVRGVLAEGIHMIVPYVNHVELMEVRTQKEQSDASAASKDLQMVSTTLALNFHVAPMQAGDLYRRVGVDFKARVIDPAVQESIKMVTAQFTAEQLIKNRSMVKSQVEAEITRRLQAYDIIVEPMGLSITNFSFSRDFESAIEAKQVAQQDAEKQRYVLQMAELQRQTQVTRAKGAAEAARLNAAALQVQGGSKVLAREWIEKWDGHVPTVSGTGGGGVILDINSLMKPGQ